MKSSSRNRKGVAAVEAALTLPLLLLIWLGSYEMIHVLSLKQQSQLLCTTAANRVIESNDAFEDIEAEILSLSEAIGIVDCVVDVSRLDSDIVETKVVVDRSKNSVMSAAFGSGFVTSSYYSYREE